MQDPDQLFRRYQKTRDPARIAEVFDLLAPRLLRLAIHLVGHADEAEDLVQETFLAAIERTDDFEPKRELVPWLSGILANQARYAKRRAARDPDPARLRERIEHTPLEEAEGAELSGTLAKALDRLEEPYRRALVLRLRHGMKPADIAHALDESPGAVRVRLHRGMEKLRRLLPAGFASAAFLLVEPTRGLEAIRRVVVAKATAATVAGTTSLALGGVLMTKQVVLAAAVVLAVVVVAALAPWPGGVEADEDQATTEGVVTAPLAPPEATENEVALTGTDAGEEEREALGTAPTADLVPLRGRVIGGVDETPVPGALVELHPPASHTMRALREEAFAYARQQNGNGSLLVWGGWPQLGDQTWEAMQAAAAGAVEDALVVYGRPAPNSVPVATARTNADGEFALDVPRAGGTLRCIHDDYPTRDVPAPDPTLELTIHLHQGGVLRGRIVELDGTPIEERVSLLFWTTVGSHATETEQGLLVGNLRGSWAVETEVDGTFEVSLPSPTVQVQVRTPQFNTLGATLATGTGIPVEILLTRIPYLHVADAATGAPIEHFALIGREASAGNVRWAGRFFAPDGRYDLFKSDAWKHELGRAPFVLTVWAEGHLPWQYRFTDITSHDVIEAALEPGAPPAIEGRVLESGVPVADVLVQLQPYYPLQWSTKNESTVDAHRTGEDGGFRLEGPEGSYLLRIARGECIHVREVTLPDPTPLVIDLARLAEIDVLVEDAIGTPQADYTVVLSDATGRSDWRQTDETGHVVFPYLPAGPFEVRVPRASTKTSFVDPVSRPVEIADGGRENVRVTLPVVGEPRRPRVVTEPSTDVAGWHARAGDGDYEWLALEPDGTIPVDLQSLNWGTFEIESDAGRRWQVDVPLDAPDGHEVLLRLDGPRYEGVLLDLANDRPLDGIRISAHGGPDLPITTAVTDDVGRFVLYGTSDAPHRLTFNDELDRPAWINSYGEMKGIGFRASAPPGDPTLLTIRIPRLRSGAFRGLGGKLVSGHVRRAGGEPLAGWRVNFYCDIPGPDGTVELWTSAGLTTTDDEGSYAVELARVPRYRAFVFSPDRGPAVVTETWDGLPSAEEDRDFVVE